jgi:hypothetical protein
LLTRPLGDQVASYLFPESLGEQLAASYLFPESLGEQLAASYLLPERLGEQLASYLCPETSRRAAS